jgi:transcriptional regulator with XRE-family HTH domain
MNTFGHQLRGWRRAAGLSQRKLAELAGVDFSYISKLENGHLRAPAAETVMRFADVLRCAPEELFAAARKLPEGIGERLAREPAAIRFLTEASQIGLSQEEWDRMIGQLRGLRPNGSEGSEK